MTAAVSAYGGAVLARANEQAADATVGWGRALLQRIFGVAEEEQEVPEAVADLAADPDNPDLQAVLRVHIGKLLAADPELAGQVRELLDQARAEVGPAVTVTASGSRSVAIGRDNSGSVTTGDHSPISGPGSLKN
ncbi:hypothetical protein ACWEQG_35380 [Microbispora sp. NPDC004025]